MRRRIQLSAGKKGQIDSDKVVVQDVFSRFWFRIPDYQRAYVWGKDEISELIDDVNFASQHNPDSQYFLGSMVLRKATSSKDGLSFEEHEVLDGQQRLTTLMLMLACIRDRVADVDLKGTCRDMLYQKENKWRHVPGRNRLIYDIRDKVGDFIERFVKADDGTRSGELAGIAVNKNLSLANMAAGIQTIHTCFDDLEQFSGAEDFDRFVGYLLNNALFIYVATEDLDDAFRLFTILNDRGIPLSNSDILKAKILVPSTETANAPNGLSTGRKLKARWGAMSSIAFCPWCARSS